MPILNPDLSSSVAGVDSIIHQQEEVGSVVAQCSALPSSGRCAEVPLCRGRCAEVPLCTSQVYGSPMHEQVLMGTLCAVSMCCR